MSGRPPKPWERAGGTDAAAAAPAGSGAASTSEVKPGESPSVAGTGLGSPNVAGRPMPPRPWERPNVGGYGGYSNTAGGYGSTVGGYGSTVGGYGSTVGGYGSTGYGSTGYGGITPYNRQTYGSYGGGYGSGYGGYGAGGMYGSNMYNRYGGYGGMSGVGYGGGMMGGPYGGGLLDPNNPNGPGGPPPRAPGFWQTMLRVLHGVVSVFGRITMLVDENTQAFHFFMTALLQLADRAGLLYGELARFVFRLLGIRTRKRKGDVSELKGPEGVLALDDKPHHEGGGWDNVWGGSRSSPAS